MLRALALPVFRAILRGKERVGGVAVRSSQGWKMRTERVQDPGELPDHGQESEVVSGPGHHRLKLKSASLFNSESLSGRILAQSVRLPPSVRGSVQFPAAEVGLVHPVSCLDKARTSMNICVLSYVRSGSRRF